MKSIGIIGAGISSLTMAVQLSRMMKQSAIKHNIKIYERQKYSGGRIHSHTLSYNSQQFCMDMGANLIDFENEQAQVGWHQILPSDISKNIQTFKQPFLLYQFDNIHNCGYFKKGDYQKNRYFYKGGFNKLTQDMLNYLNKQQIYVHNNHQVKKLTYKQNKINIQVKNIKQNIMINQVLDYVYISCPSPKTIQIVDNQENKNNKQIIQIIQYCKQIKYTKQISVAFVTKQCPHKFSSILFVKHPVITFICSHQQKYKQNSIVIQTSQIFSNQLFNQSQQAIVQKVIENMPKQIKQIILSNKYLVYRWPQSLIKANNKIQQYFPIGQKVFLIGDSVMKKSRVSGAVLSTKMNIAKL